MSSSSSLHLPRPSLKSTHTLLSSLSAHVRSTSALDTILLTLSYTLRLLTPSSSSTSISTSPLTTILSNTLSHLPKLPLTTHLHVTPLITILEDFRLRLRLLSLLPILSSLISSFSRPPTQLPDKLVAWTQGLALTIFQATENLAYLAEKGVVGIKKARVAKLWVWSARAWAVWTGLELLRLERVRRARCSAFLSSPAAAPTATAPTTTTTAPTASDADAKPPTSSPSLNKEKTNIEALTTRDDEDIQARSAALATQATTFRKQTQEEREWWRKWRKDVLVNAAYAPMALHYSLGSELLSEKTIAGLGVLVAGSVWGLVV